MFFPCPLNKAKAAGNALFAKGKYNEAMDEYSKGLQFADDTRIHYIDPTSNLLVQQLHANKSLCLFNIGKYDCARFEARACVNLPGGGNYAKGWFRYGIASRALFHGPRLESAAEYFHRSALINGCLADRTALSCVELDKVCDELEKVHTIETMTICNLFIKFRQLWFDFGLRQFIKEDLMSVLQEKEELFSKKYKDLSKENNNNHINNLNVFQKFLAINHSAFIRHKRNSQEPIDGIGCRCGGPKAEDLGAVGFRTSSLLFTMLPEWNLQEMNSVDAFVTLFDSLLSPATGFDFIKHLHDNLLVKHVDEFIEQTKKNREAVLKQEPKVWMLNHFTPSSFKTSPPEYSFEDPRFCSSCREQNDNPNMVLPHCACDDGSSSVLLCSLISGRYVRDEDTQNQIIDNNKNNYKNSDVVPQKNRRLVIKFAQVLLRDIMGLSLYVSGGKFLSRQNQIRAHANQPALQFPKYITSTLVVAGMSRVLSRQLHVDVASNSCFSCASSLVKGYSTVLDQDGSLSSRHSSRQALLKFVWKKNSSSNAAVVLDGGDEFGPAVFFCGAACRDKALQELKELKENGEFLGDAADEQVSEGVKKWQHQQQDCTSSSATKE